MRELLNSGLTLGEIFATTSLRTTTAKSAITASTVRLPIQDHAHWQESPTELIFHDNVAEPVFQNGAGGSENIEYLTETPYFSEEETTNDEHKPIIINDRGLNYPTEEDHEQEEDYYYYDYYYDDSIFDESKNETSSSQRTPRTPRSFDNPKRIGRKILSAAGPAHHLTMSERDMDHMMMMMLHNAVTQVNDSYFS